MSELIGDTAIVIGAGMGGLTAAAALSEFFLHITVLDRDELPAHPAHRPSIAQGRHAHALLGGGLRALDPLFPDIGDDLGSRGAVLCRAGLDVRIDRPGFDPFPQRDLGWPIFAMSRPLIEFVVRNRATRLSNVALRTQCNVLEIVATKDMSAAAGVRFKDMNGDVELLTANLIIDASARGVPTMDFNPVYGQGMSVAAIEAAELKRLLGERNRQDDPLGGLAPAFFAATSTQIDTPWGAANLDFVYPKTRGARPEGFEETLKFLSAVNRLAAREPTVHKLIGEVQHLLRPSTAYREPKFMRQIAAEMAFPWNASSRNPAADNFRNRITTSKIRLATGV